MNSESHLVLNVVILGVIFILLYFLFGWNILNLNLVHLIIAVYIFSNLPDIDNAKSKMSKTFFIFYIVLGLFGISSLFSANILVGLLQISVALILGYYHYIVAEDSKQHRKFPHTFTFGVFTSLILWFFTSFAIFLIGLLCFILHIIADNHIHNALERDIRFWTNLLRKSSLVR